VEPVSLDVAKAATSTGSVAEKAEVELLVDRWSDCSASVVNAAEVLFPSLGTSEEGACSATGSAETLAGVGGLWTSALAKPSSLALLSASQVSHFHSSRCVRP